MSFIPFLVGLVFITFDDCSNCQCEDGKVRLCKPHLDEEKGVLRSAKKELRRPKAQDRLSALVRVAALAESHSNVPSPKAAEALALGLKDKSYTIRRDTIRLFLRGQDPETAVTSILAAHKDAKKLWTKADKYLVGWAKKLKSGSSRYDPEENERFNHHVNVISYWEAVLVALGHFPEVRAEKEIVDFLESKLTRLPGRVLIKGTEAALRIGCQASVAAVIALLSKLSTALESGKLRHQYEDIPVAILGGMILKGVSVATRATYEEIATQVIEVVQSKGLTGYPGTSPTDAERWEAWFESNKESFGVPPNSISEPVHINLKVDGGLEIPGLEKLLGPNKR